MSDPTILPLALTLGEPAGIGPDLTIQLWHRRIELRLPPFYLIADPEFIKRRVRLLGLDVAVSVVTPAQATDIFGRALPISVLDSPVTAHPVGRTPRAHPQQSVRFSARSLTFWRDKQPPS